MRPWVAILGIALLMGRAIAAAEPVPSTPPQRRVAAERFGAQIAKAFNDRDRAGVESLVDMRALANRAADVGGLSGTIRDEFVRDMQGAGINQLVSSYFTALDLDKGHVRFMRATNHAPPRTLVRTDLGAQGSQYMEFVVSTDAGGRTRAIDWWQASTGELASTTLGGLARQGAARDPGPLLRFFGFKNDDPVTAQFDKIREYQRTGRYADALEVIKQIPEPTASMRSLLTLRASMAAFASRADEYDLALAKLARLHGNDPATAFILIDYHVKHGDWPSALAAIDVLETRVGRDGVTRLMRANTLLLAGDVAGALESAQESVALEPDRLDSQDVRATLLVYSGRYSDAVAAYKQIESRFAIKLQRASFTADPKFAPFVRSAAFRNWLPR